MSEKEIELKYSLKSPAYGEEILENSFIKQIGLPDSRSTILLEAIYYDDEAQTLAARRIGYRVRKENEKIIATVKWSDRNQTAAQNKCKGISEEVSHNQQNAGLSNRYESNIEVKTTAPDTEIFKDYIKNPEILEILLTIKPIPLFKTQCKREILMVKHNKSIIEIAFDNGRIIAEKPVRTSEKISNENESACSSTAPAIPSCKEVPICELECELKSGNISDLIEFGKILETKFDIKPFELSKLKRGLDLYKSLHEDK